MGILFLLIFGLCVCFCVCIMEYIDDKQAEKHNKLVEIERIQSRVLEDFGDVASLAFRYGNEYYNSLTDFANKMDKLLEVKDDLKPYDVYYHNRLYEESKGVRSRFIGRIVIDKNLVPKFMVTAQSTIPSQLDIELEVALTSDKVREFAEKCRGAKMNADIEAYRKDKIRNILNAK